MYNLTVDTAHTFFVGEGQWLAHNACDFGRQSDLRQALGITDPNVDAHHLIPWALRNEPIVQKAAEAGWHMNHAYNGIPMPHPHSYGGHPIYTKRVKQLLDDLYLPSMNADDAYRAVMSVADHMRSTITKNKLVLLR
jgi:hypothetical protein